MTEMVTSVVCELFFLAVHFFLALAQLPRPYAGLDTLAAAGEAVQEILASVSDPHCYVTLLSHGNSSATTVATDIRKLWAPWGVALLEVAVNGVEAQATQDQLFQAIREARRLRQLSWCVTVVVVSDDPVFLAAFAQWSLKGRLLVWSTRLLVLTRLPLQQLQDLQETFSMTNAMLLIMDDSDESVKCGVYVHMPYGPQGAQPLRIASWTPSRGLILTSHLQLFPEKFIKLYYGPTLVVTAEESEPHLALVRGEDTTSSIPSFTGPMVNLLNIIANDMNFTYRYSRPPDGAWGVKLDDGSWTGMVGLVGRREVDIGLGPIDVTALRAEVVDFTSAILTETVRIVGARGRPEVDPWGFLLPFTSLVWATILTTLLVVPAVMFLLSTCSGLKSYSNTKSSNLVFTYARVLLQQDILMPPELWWERLVLGVWMMMTLVLTRSYAGTLMSYLAVRHIPQPYQSLRDVMDDPSVIMVWQGATSYVQYFRSMTSGVFREIADSEKERIKYVRSVEFYKVMDTLVRRGDHVIIAGELYARVLRSQDFSLKGKCDFYISKERFIHAMVSMIGQKDSPLVAIMSKRIKAITYAGLYEHWMEAYMSNSTSCAHPPSKIAVNTALKVHNLWGMFVVVFGGLIGSVFVLGAEVFIAGLIIT
ncbi:probable glutamate receptor [Panulirus ornatus]|uniref:probable glutamate receptor n=1 Tax=Panulirus ornatus TaxID=150431 RepID=UPI003A8919BF